MATLGYVVPEGQQSKESFHALRRTTEGLLYYTKVDKDSTETLDLRAVHRLTLMAIHKFQHNQNILKR